MQPRNQKGVALLAVIFLIVVMAFVGVIFLSLSSTNTSQSVNEVYSSRALYLAEGGLEQAGRYLLKREDGTQTTYSCDTGPNSVNARFSAPTALGNGQFTITSVYNNTMPPTTLFSFTNATDTTISVVSVSGYAPFGRIMIDKEMIDYTAMGMTASSCSPYTPPCFTGAIRGTDGTITAPHLIGTRIAQTECLLTSTGGVPTVNAGTNQRVVSQADVVQSGWAVGNTGGGTTHPRMFLWNGTSWADRTSLAPNAIGNLTSVSMLSPVEGWGVSTTGGLIRWNGANWSTFLPAASVQLNSIYLNTVNDGWAVGNAGGVPAQQPFIYYWNGTTWSLRNLGLPTINLNLNAIYCNSSPLPVNCWAVGTAGGVAAQQPLILYWNGTTSSWSVRKTGLPAISRNLRSIYCNSTSIPIDCWAVGNAGGIAAQQPLILYWNGTTSAWSVRKTGLGTINRTLNSVACVDSSNCWAVGNAGGIGQRPLILFWNGAAWSLKNSVRNFAGTAVTINLPLQSVTCVTSNDCWAVGNPGIAGQRPLALHWNGTDWIIETLNSQNATLNSIALIGPKRSNIAWREVPQ
jgi:Tfp pilus assembly protein PilX